MLTDWFCHEPLLMNILHSLFNKNGIKMLKILVSMRKILQPL